MLIKAITGKNNGTKVAISQLPLLLAPPIKAGVCTGISTKDASFYRGR